MGGVFYSPKQLGEMLGITEAQVLEYRRHYGWPSFKAGKTIRFTQANVEQIVAAHSVKKPTKPKAESVAIAGQTKRSSRRAS